MDTKSLTDEARTELARRNVPDWPYRNTEYSEALTREQLHDLRLSLIILDAEESLTDVQRCHVREGTAIVLISGYPPLGGFTVRQVFWRPNKEGGEYYTGLPIPAVGELILAPHSEYCHDWSEHVGPDPDICPSCGKHLDCTGKCTCRKDVKQ